MSTTMVLSKAEIEIPTLSRSRYLQIIESSIADAELPAPEADWLRKHAEETDEVAFGSFDIGGVGCAMKQAGVYEPVNGRATPVIFSRFAFAFDEHMRTVAGLNSYRVAIED